ncbi:sarcoplasmic calcium-binding protein-like isoform X2 [Mercenaria mercenaria]|uniref:sarcoplasmic calcium-binding protein-like isoform X2 n=1 Tax=Mercenaria mercenaria TaxID=6596 RepID=UPI001E1E1B3F|nr:sarcoplasmic calcium-binding protein-like isoform X2 [Mercenaria mercenaria]
MATDYLVAKWKLWYKSLDVNHDGKISIEDVEESRAKFSDLHKLDAEKSKQVQDNFTKWWNEFVFRGKTGEISETEFIDALNNDLKADSAKFKADMDRCFNIFFDVIDTNKDRSISEEEFLIAFKAYGHENVALDTKFFQAYNPKDGLVSLREIVDSWIDFVTGDDSSKSGSIVKTAFESGV